MKGHTGRELKISSGNTKLGKIPNLSLPPITTCRPDATCKVDCYANKAYRTYPTVRNAWESNLQLYKEDPEGFFTQLYDWLWNNDPKQFRIHVSGDCPDARYFRVLCDVISLFPSTTFVMFTKRYELPFHLATDNFKIILSMWPGLALPDWLEYMPKAWLADDVRFPIAEPYISCPGKCDDCSACWSAVSAELPVVFNRH